MVLNRLNNNCNANGSRDLDNNNARLVGIALGQDTFIMLPRNLWQELCSYSNLELAFRKARKHKTLKPYVIEFEKDLKNNLLVLRTELLLHSYRPKPLKTFVVRDPKVRIISKSDFRDRVVHHALCNIIEPIFEKSFIYDSYANRIGKGTLAAVKRFDYFKRSVSKNNIRNCYVLKADIKHYFETVSHEKLLRIIRTKIKDAKVLWLIKLILSNHETKVKGYGMPLGNLTSQFFANVYLNELDWFIKNILKVKYYLRYVDDFILFDTCVANLVKLQLLIDEFLKRDLQLTLHPQKSKIRKLSQGINLLGFRGYYYQRLLRKSNPRNYICRLHALIEQKELYEIVYNSFQGWWAHAKLANTYKLRKKVASLISQNYPNKISSAEISRLNKIYPQRY